MPTSSSSTWARSIPRPTACCASSCGSTAKRLWASSASSATCIAASRKSPRTAPTRCSIPTSTAWITSPRSRTAWDTARRSKSFSTWKRRRARNTSASILTELNRIASHQLWLGTHALDIGAITPLFYTFRDREEILKIFEKYCGARLTTHAFRIGGLQYETYDGFEKDVKNFVYVRAPKIDEYEELLTTNRIWLERTKGVGKISGKDAIALGVTGPVLRASGVKWDIRKAQPYANYKNFDFEIPTGENGDTYDRYLVRMAEMRQSLRIIEQAVEDIPEGPIMAKVPKVMKPPVGEIYHSIEAPKGELGYFIVSDGSTQPYRMRVRPPSFVNLQALDVMCRGQLVADVIAVIGTLDIVLGEVDR